MSNVIQLPPAAVLEHVKDNADYGHKFHGWLSKNWHVYKLFQRLAADWAIQHEHCGAKMIWEVMRYKTSIEQNDSVDDWTGKLGNNYTPDCARLFEHLNPQHQGLFELRKRPSCGGDPIETEDQQQGLELA